jgi:hypothetical protein
MKNAGIVATLTKDGNTLMMEIGSQLNMFDRIAVE